MDALNKTFKIISFYVAACKFPTEITTESATTKRVKFVCSVAVFTMFVDQITEKSWFYSRGKEGAGALSFLRLPIQASTDFHPTDTEVLPSGYEVTGA